MRLYLVGGAVRDRLLHLSTSTDEDWVVVGSTPEEMLTSGFKAVGRGFPVFIKPGHKGEYALARSEKKVAHGYRGFTFNSEPGVTLEEDLRRRDLTVNSIAYDEVSGRHIDPWGGIRDIEKRVLRHVSEAFVEDPLRVLRVARFAARFSSLGFTVAPETHELMKQMVRSGEIEALVPERVFKEMTLAMQENNPTRFFEELEEVGALSVLTSDFVAFSRTACYRPALKALGNSSRTKLDAFDRFLLLALYAGACSVSLPGMCQKLKMPAQYHKAAKSACRFSALLKKNPHFDTDTLLAIVECFDGIRNAKRLQQLTRVLAQMIPSRQIPCILEKAIQLKEDIAAAGHMLRSLDLATLLENVPTANKPGLVKTARRKALFSIVEKSATRRDSI